MQYFAYIHCKPDGTPFYVGKGNLRRSKEVSRKNVWHTSIVNKYGKENIGIAKLECSSEKIAFDLEKGLIKCLRRQDIKLTNTTNGGEGSSGYKFTEERKAKISARMKGTNNPFYGKTHSEATKKFLSDNAIREGADLETRKIRSAKGKTFVGTKNPFYGKKHTEETKCAIAKLKTGKPSKVVYTDAMRIASSERVTGEKHWNYGKKTSDKVKAAVSAAAKAKVGFKWMTNGIVSKQVRPEYVETLLGDGYIFGKKIV